MSKVEVDKPIEIFGSLEGKTMTDIFPAFFATKGPSPHDAPPPAVVGDDVSKDHALNEWALNHLALNEEQKQWLIIKLQEDQLKQPKKIQKEFAKKRRVKKTDSEKEKPRADVKSMTKETS